MSLFRSIRPVLAKLGANESRGKVFCLVEAPTADGTSSVPREAHGLGADEVLEVQAGT